MEDGRAPEMASACYRQWQWSRAGMWVLGVVECVGREKEKKYSREGGSGEWQCVGRAVAECVLRGGKKMEKKWERKKKRVGHLKKWEEKKLKGKKKKEKK